MIQIFKILVIVFIFVLAFALGFHILLKHEEVFGTIQDSILKTLVMMSGELEYANIFFGTDGKVPFPGVTYTIFVIFILLISIVTLNLLVGLTVDDIKREVPGGELDAAERLLWGCWVGNVNA